MRSDFSLFALFTAGLATIADAYTHPRGPVPKGNPIFTPTLNEIVPKGRPFNITWHPTTQGTVTLLLLRGPSTNVRVLHPIAQKIPNNGHHIWHPNMDLHNDVTHYGIQLVVDHNGQYQYTPQFGIGPKHGGHHHGDHVDIARLDVAGDYESVSTVHGETIDYTTEVVTAYTTYCPEATSVTMGSHTYTVTEATSLTITNCPCTVTHHKSTYTISTPVSSPTHQTPSTPTYTQISSITHLSVTSPTNVSPSSPGYTPGSSPAHTPASSPVYTPGSPSGSSPATSPVHTPGSATSPVYTPGSTPATPATPATSPVSTPASYVPPTTSSRPPYPWYGGGNGTTHSSSLTSSTHKTYVSPTTLQTTNTPYGPTTSGPGGHAPSSSVPAAGVRVGASFGLGVAGAVIAVLGL